MNHHILTILPLYTAFLSAIALTGSPATAQEPQEVKLFPDWNQISLSDLEGIATPGSIGDEYNKKAGYDLSRTWQAGSPPDTILKLGDLEASLNPGSFTLEEINRLSGTLDFDTLPLSEFPLLGEQTLESLVEAVPSLGLYTLAQVEIAQDLVDLSGFSSTQFNSQNLASLVQKPSIGELPLARLDLTQYGTDSIPHLSLAQLKDFENYLNSLVSEIPGLSEVPLGQFPNPISPNGSVVARIDFVWGNAESNRTRTISGSYVEGFNVECDSNCSYLSLDDLENIGDSIQLPYEGSQWIAGQNHWVSGGTGCLSGGREPTGIHPFGNTFKTVLWTTDETTDSATIVMFFNLKTPCGESAYFIGPIPFPLGEVRVNDWIFVGGGV